MLEAEITTSGDVMVEGQHIGHLYGFRFTADPQAAGEAAKALNTAAQKALASEIEGRAKRVHEAVDEAFVLANDGIIRWLGEAIGKIIAGDHVLEPRVRVLSDEQLTGESLDMVQRRLDLWLGQHVKKLLGALADLEKGEGLEGMARGIAFQVAESLGVLDRTQVGDDVKNLPQEARAALRKFGIRFGAYHLYLPALLKPAPRALAAQLWALKHGGVDEVKGLDEVPHLAASGRTSFAADKDVPKGFYRAAGFRVCGERAVRVDILERLADLVRPAVNYRPGATPGDPPAGSADGDGFVVTVAMTSLAGCSGESFASILRSLGYVSDRRKGPPITVPLLAKAATEPVQPIVPETDADNAAEDPEASAADASSVEAPETAAASLAEAASPQDTETTEVQVRSTETSEPIETAAATEAPVLDVASAAPMAEASAADVIEAGTEPAVVEDVLIEVWRPHRHHHARRPDQRSHKGRPPRREPAVAIAASGETAPSPDAPAQQRHERQDRPHRQNAGRRPERQPHASNGGAPTQAAEGATADAARPQGKPRYEGRKDQRRPGQEGQQRSGHRPRDDERRQGRGASFATTEKPQGRDRQPDPNSPFAKLLILKERMENQGGKD